MNDNDNIDEIRRDIEDTRQRISVEIEALEGKLTPAHAKEVVTEKVKESIVETKDRFVHNAVETKDRLVHNAVETKDRLVHGIGDSAWMVRDNASRLGTDFVATARANPIPLALIGVGAGWLVWEMVRPRQDVEIEVEPLFDMDSDDDLGLSASPAGTFTESPTATSYTSSYGMAGDDVSVGGALGGTSAGSYGYGSSTYGSSSYGESGSYQGSSSFDATSKLAGAKDAAAAKLSSAKGVIGERARTVKDRASHAFTDARGKASTLASDYKGKAGQLAVRGREGVSHAGHVTTEAYSANPIAFGALALAAGVGLAMLIPTTRKEDQLLGSAHRKVIDRAKNLADGAKTVAIDAIKEGANAVKETAKREMNEGKLNQG